MRNEHFIQLDKTIVKLIQNRHDLDQLVELFVVLIDVWLKMLLLNGCQLNSQGNEYAAGGLIHNILSFVGFL